MAIIRRVIRASGEILLTGLAILGAGCIILVGAAFLFDITLILFKTGSMSPSIPGGSVAVVREIPATQVRIGDVVTVDRPGQLPVTHRVTSVRDGPDADRRVITMKGDANVADDPYPYTVATVRIVVVSVPGVARVIAGLSSPHVLGMITIGASLLVTWAFWPRDPGGSRPSRRKGGSQGGQLSEVRKHSESDKLGEPSPALGNDVVQLVKASGHSEAVTVGLDALPDTGADNLKQSLLPAIGAVVAGLLFAGLGGLRSRAEGARGRP